MFIFRFKIIILCFLIIFIISCDKKDQNIRIEIPQSNLSESSIIPKPVSIIPTNKAFALNEFTEVVSTLDDTLYHSIRVYLKESLDLDHNLKFRNDAESTFGTIIFDGPLSESENKEAYKLNISEDTISINSNTAAGAFRAIQTLRQLVPETTLDTLATFKVWPIPSGTIIDEPEYEYRGTMLDVARHFFTVDELKKYMDLLAYYKINHLHLHLSDDQGWRIEIKKWPKLTEIGGLTEVGGGKGGFYSQEEYKDIVSYATERFITIIPEIDMPGHTNASYVAYPFLNGTGKKAEPYSGMRVGFSTFDTQKDSVYLFIDDVIKELSDMTPGPYFHIGGDESHVTKKEDYLYFINRVEAIVQKHGKRLIGWDEVANADLDASSIAQYWNNIDNVKTAAKKNMKIILSPAKKMYLDMKYNEDSKFGLSWAGMIPVDSAYNWSPYQYVKDLPKDQILGLEAPLWSETISNSSELEYLAFPRIIGYAELSWTKDENRNWDDYKNRLSKQQSFLEKRQVNYYKASEIDW